MIDIGWGPTPMRINPANSARNDVIERLRKICGLLASSHEGERAAAVNRANAVLEKRRLSWAEVIGSEPNGEIPHKPPAPDIDLTKIPEGGMSDAALKKYAEVFLAEHAVGAIDLGNTSFLISVMDRERWSHKQREGLVRSLRRAWMIRREAAL
jgi:hypothetical protein